MASKEANRLKYQYNKKYVEAYWERKAQQQNGETATKKTRKTVRQTTISCFDDDLQPEMADVEITVCRNGKSDERYIKALELANKRLNGENNRLIRLMIKYKNLIRQITELYYGEEWKSHATLTLLAKQDLAPFGYNMIDPLKSWCWGSILFYPFKISRFS